MVELGELRAHIIDELQPARDYRGPRGKYICPLCGAGAKRKGTGGISVERDMVHWHCFACGRYGDIFDLYRQRDGMSAADAARAVREKYGQGGAPAAPIRSEPMRSEPQRVDVQGIAEYIARCEAAMPGSDGHSFLMGQRGLSPDTVRRFRLGWDAARRAIVIPYDKKGRFYIARSIDAKRYTKPKREDAGPEPVYNQAALFSDVPAVFVVESQLCAISIAQVGGCAVALGGCGCSHLLEAVKKRRPTAVLVLCLDNETEPDKAARVNLQEVELSAQLQGVGIHVLRDKRACGVYKDPNEHLCADPGGFADAVQGVLQDISEIIKKE